jgi:hypothetical protein
MKVENPRTAPGPAVGSLSPETPRRPAAAEHSSTADRVRLSGDLGLVRAALQAADLSSVRPDAVARGRALLTGAQDLNLDALADRLIDALTRSHDEPL